MKILQNYKESKYYMNSVFNQTMTVCQTQFDLQETLIQKYAGVVQELLGKKCVSASGDGSDAEADKCQLPPNE